MTGNVGSGLVLIGAGVGLFLGWWSGAFEAIIGEVTGRVRAPGTVGVSPSAVPAPAAGLFNPNVMLDPSRVRDLRSPTDPSLVH